MPKKTVKRRANIERPFNMGTMSSAAFFGTIRSTLRNTFRYNWEPAKEALKLASRPNQSANKRLKTEFQCAHCKKWGARSECEIDHITECGSLKSYEDIPEFLKKLLPEDPSAYQILCVGCHKIKTRNYMESKK